MSRLLRRDWLKTAGLAGAGLGIASFGEETAEAQARASEAAAPVIGPSNWPFEEVRIPFRERKAKVKWPNNAKLAVRVYLTLEWSSAPSNPAGAFYKPDLYSISRDSQYTFTAGCYRAIDLLAKHGLKASIFPNGGVVAAYPELHKELFAAGHEITARSWDQGAAPPLINPDQMATEIKRTTDAIAQLTGTRPVGWISPGAKCTPLSVQTLAEMGYLWVGDLTGDDIPYGLKLGNRSIVAIPHRQESTNDFHIFQRTAGSASRSADEAFEFFRSTFDSYYRTATDEAPNMMMYGIHPFWSCWPDRIQFHDKALNYMKGFKDVWFSTHQQLAQYWKDTYLKA